MRSSVVDGGAGKVGFTSCTPLRRLLIDTLNLTSTLPAGAPPVPTPLAK